MEQGLTFDGCTTGSTSKTLQITGIVSHGSFPIRRHSREKKFQSPLSQFSKDPSPSIAAYSAVTALRAMTSLRSYLGSSWIARQASQEMLLPGNATELNGQSDLIHALRAA